MTEDKSILTCPDCKSKDIAQFPNDRCMCRKCYKKGDVQEFISEIEFFHFAKNENEY